MRGWVILWLGAVLVAGAAGASSRAGFELTGADTGRRARVAIVQDPDAIETFNTRPDRIRAMVNRGLLALTGKTNATRAWLSLVSTQDTVGLKVFSAAGAISGTRPAVVAAVVQGLISAGVPPGKIVVWDKHLADLRAAGFADFAPRFGVRVAGSAEAGYDEKNFYDTPLLGNLIWGDSEFGKKHEGAGRKSFVSKLVSQELTKIIMITPLLNHYQAGVIGSLYSLALGSGDNTQRFESDATRLADAVPELVALPILGDRVALNIVDALICQYEGESHSLLHYSTVLGQLRFSTDPVALDVLSLRELERQRKAAKLPPLKQNLDLFRNASLLEIGVSEERLIQVELAP